MARCIRDKESLLDAISVPGELQSFIKTTLHVLGHISTTRSSLRLYPFFSCVDVIRKVKHIKPGKVVNVSVGDEADPDAHTGVRVYDVVDNLAESVLGTLDPRTHRGCAVEDKAQVQ